MAKYKVKKPLNDNQDGGKLAVGDVIERTVKEVTEFEKKHGTDYLERIKEDSDE